MLAMTSLLAVSCQKAGEKRAIKAKVSAAGKTTADTKTADAKANETASAKKYTEVCSKELITEVAEFNKFGSELQKKLSENTIQKDSEALKEAGNLGKEKCDKITAMLTKYKEEGCVADKNTNPVSVIQKEKIENNCNFIAQNTKVQNAAAISSQERQKNEEVLTKNLKQIQENKYVMSKEMLTLMDEEAEGWNKVLIGDLVLENQNDITKAIDTDTKPICTAIENSKTTKVDQKNPDFAVTELNDLSDVMDMPHGMSLRKGQKATVMHLTVRDEENVKFVRFACLNIAKHEITQKFLVDVLGAKVIAKESLNEQAQSASGDSTQASSDATRASGDNSAAKTQVTVVREDDSVSASGDATKASGDTTKAGSAVAAKKGSGAVESAAGTQTKSPLLSAKVSGDSSTANSDVTSASQDSTKASEDVTMAEADDKQQKTEVTGDVSSLPKTTSGEDKSAVATATASKATTSTASDVKAIAVNPYQSLNDLAKNKNMYFQVQRYTSLKKATYLESVTLSGTAQTNFMVNGAVVSQAVAYKAYADGGMACRLVTKKADEDIKDFVIENNQAQITAVGGNANYINLYFRKDNKLMSLQCISKAEKTIGAISRTLGTSASIVLRQAK